VSISAPPTRRSPPPPHHTDPVLALRTSTLHSLLVSSLWLS
jgi:hypothetical protein